MDKKVFLFPGQGSQEVGMARDLFGEDDYFNSLVEHASQITNQDLKKICLRGPEKKLIKASFLQPLIVAVSLGYLRRVREKGISADFVLGHSLGEITALACAGVIDDNLAISIATKRGQLMDQAAECCDGSMMAVFSIDKSKVSNLIEELDLKHKVVIANYNTSKQIVLSGDKSCLLDLSIIISKQGGRCRKLMVSGPWHSHYIKEAKDEFEIWVESFEFKKPGIPIIFNANAIPETNPEEIKKLITMQLSGPVFFKQCMDYCRDQHADVFLEIGPGRVLSGLVRANGFMNDTSIFNVNNLRGLNSAVSDLTFSLGKH